MLADISMFIGILLLSLRGTDELMNAASKIIFMIGALGLTIINRDELKQVDGKNCFDELKCRTTIALIEAIVSSAASRRVPKSRNFATVSPHICKQ